MGNKNFAPVVVFVYNRLDHTKRLLESLEKNRLVERSELYIFSDSSARVGQKKKVNEVKQYINNYIKKSTFKRVTVINAESHQGLANSVISGVSKIIQKYKKVIVLEDDLIVSKDFLEYMNEALDYYKNDKKIWSISGYAEPLNFLNDYEKDVFLCYRGNSWGWATWLNRWENIDWELKDFTWFRLNPFARDKFNRGGNDLSSMLIRQKKGQIDSWAVRWCYAQNKFNTFAVYPRETRVKNNGLDGQGTHCGKTKKYDVCMKEDHLKCKFADLKMNTKIAKEFRYWIAPTYKKMWGEYLRRKS